MAHRGSDAPIAGVVSQSQNSNIPPLYVASFGFGLMALSFLSAALAFYAYRTGGMGEQPPIGIGVFCGFIIVTSAIGGLVLLFQSIGLSNPSAAFGLPSGSVRALLALSLVIIFLAVASVELVVDFKENDQAKQILTIAATALTTVVGFYFGSKSSSDATKAANDAVQGANVLGKPEVGRTTDLSGTASISADGAGAPASGTIQVLLAIEDFQSLSSTSLTVDDVAVPVPPDGHVEVPLTLGAAHKIVAAGQRAGHAVSGNLTITPLLDDEQKPLSLALT